MSTISWLLLALVATSVSYVFCERSGPSVPLIICLPFTLGLTQARSLMLKLCAHLTLRHRLPQHVIVEHPISTDVDGTLDAGRRPTLIAPGRRALRSPRCCGEPARTNLPTPQWLGAQSGCHWSPNRRPRVADLSCPHRSFPPTKPGLFHRIRLCV